MSSDNGVTWPPQQCLKGTKGEQAPPLPYVRYATTRSTIQSRFQVRKVILGLVPFDRNLYTSFHLILCQPTLGYDVSTIGLDIRENAQIDEF